MVVCGGLGALEQPIKAEVRFERSGFGVEGLDSSQVRHTWCMVVEPCHRPDDRLAQLSLPPQTDAGEEEGRLGVFRVPAALAGAFLLCPKACLAMQAHASIRGIVGKGVSSQSGTGHVQGCKPGCGQKCRTKKQNQLSDHSPALAMTWAGLACMLQLYVIWQVCAS